MRKLLDKRDRMWKLNAWHSLMIMANIVPLICFWVSTSAQPSTYVTLIMNLDTPNRDIRDADGVELDFWLSVSHNSVLLRLYLILTYVFSFSVVLLSRLILNLRLENEYMVNGDYLKTNPSRMLFSPRILGNLTAELRDSDDVDYGDDNE